MKTSVILTYCDEPYLDVTCQKLIDRAAGEVEFILGADGTDQPAPDMPQVACVERTGKQVGRRIMINRLMPKATGDYLFHVDAHCEMSFGWDAKLASAAGADGIAQSVLVNYMKKRGRMTATLYRHIFHDRKTWSSKIWPQREPQKHIEELMTFTGCAFMHHRDVTIRYTEAYSGWGSMGIEATLAAWLCHDVPTPVRLHSGVVCNHVGRRHHGSTDRKAWAAALLSPEETLWRIKDQYRRGVAPNQKRSIEWLIRKFAPVPGWEV